MKVSTRIRFGTGKQIQHNKKKRNSFTIKDFQLLILATPAILVIFIFNYIPIGGVFIAFKNVNYRDGIFKSPWVGFENFKFFFTSNDAISVTRNTLLYNAAFIFFGTIIAVSFAVMLNEITKRYVIKIFQTIFFLPYFFSWVIVSYMTYALFSPLGTITNVLKNHGINISDFYANPSYWPVFLTLLYIWKYLGYYTIIFYSGIISISDKYYEAAAIDGASRLQTIRFITLPLLTPLIVIITLLAIGRIFYSDFGLFYSVPMQNGQLYSVTQVIDTYVFRIYRSSGDAGMATAAGLYQSFIGFLLVLGSNYTIKKIYPEYGIF
ncbi:MAG TPA: sugar ABC transporter permease [Clostridiaceae bacterium]|nr:sugar ABC transporter permease [Clostridiaceae bacterium]